MLAPAVVLLLAASPAPTPSSCVLETDCRADAACVVGLCLDRCSEAFPCKAGVCQGAGPSGLSVCLGTHSSDPAPDTESNPLPTPKRTTRNWSPAGWDVFRFGMGPDDALGVAGTGAEFAQLDPSSSDPGDVEGLMLKGRPPLAIDGIDMDPLLKFLRGRLYGITLFPAWPQHTYNDKRAEFFFHLEALLTAKYGTPTRRAVPPGTTIGEISSGQRRLDIVWSKKGLEVSVTAFGDRDRDIAVLVSYVDPAMRDEAGELLLRKSRDKYRQERDRL